MAVHIVRYEFWHLLTHVEFINADPRISAWTKSTLGRFLLFQVFTEVRGKMEKSLAFR